MNKFKLKVNKGKWTNLNFKLSKGKWTNLNFKVNKGKWTNLFRQNISVEGCRLTNGVTGQVASNWGWVGTEWEMWVGTGWELRLSGNNSVSGHLDRLRRTEAEWELRGTRPSLPSRTPTTLQNLFRNWSKIFTQNCLPTVFSSNFLTQFFASWCAGVSHMKKF